MVVVLVGAVVVVLVVGEVVGRLSCICCWLCGCICGADSAFSLDKKEFEEMIKAVRDSEKLIGRVDYSLNEKREKQRRFARSLYVSKDIKEGEVFSEDNIKSVRPFYGLHPKYLKDVLGKTAKKDYEFGDRLENNTI